MSARCAIYTRKSSEEGLGQDFNALNAQREACEAFIRSQSGEGWRIVPTSYDDGGYSGGTMARPGLQRLLADVEAGLVNTIVVYKVDRLTRSLADFAKIVERLDARNASFVSVTQAFNTTTSMGRLTLNVLLSFAQFEREVTGERIRDKIAASKQKGMWMGGRAPLGYEAAGRTLAIVPEEAEIVRWIFQRYLAVKSAPILAAELEARGVRSKRHVFKDGTSIGGHIMRVGQLNYILRNRTYTGVVVHGQAQHPGLHPPIIDPELFAAVQALLDRRGGPRVQRERPGLWLRGKVFDRRGRRMHAITASKGAGRFRYYVASPKSRAEGITLRAPAFALETAINELLERVLGTPLAEGVDALVSVSLEVKRVIVRLHGQDLAAISARLRAGESAEAKEDAIAITLPIAFRRWRGGAAFFDDAGKPSVAPAPDASLIKALARAHAWRALLTQSPRVKDAAERAGANPSYFWRVTRLAYLAPDITRRIVAGQAGFLSLHRLMAIDIPQDWDAQRRLLRD